jgi:di/tricarboxylate transporter
VIVLFGAGLMAVTGRMRTDLIGLVVLFLLAISGLVTPQEAFEGFSSPAVITLAGLFVLTAAMNQAGFVHWVAARIEALTGSSETGIMTVFILVGAALSLVVNTAAAGAVLLPAVVSVAKRKEIPASRLLMPMGFGVIVGGMATIFTTANIIMSGLLQSRGGPGLTMFDFFPTGSVIVVVTLVYLLTVGKSFLPSIRIRDRRGLGSEDLAGIYAMERRLWELEVLPKSAVAGQSLAQLQLGVPVIGIWHGKQAKFNPGGEAVLEERDYLLVSSSLDNLENLKDRGLRVGRGRKIEDKDIPVMMVEFVIPPRSKVVGKTLIELDFQRRHGLTVVAIWRGGESWRNEIGQVPFQPGDALLLVGSMQRILDLAESPNYLLVDTPAYPPMSQLSSGLTLAVAAGVLAAAGLGLVSMSLAAFSGALLLVLLKVLTTQRAYAAIDWSVLFLIAGMFPLAAAMESTGLTTLLSQTFNQTFAEAPSLLPVAAIYLFTVLMTQIVGGQVSALFTGPVALSVGQELGVDLTGVAVLVAIACSNCFITSIAHPVNLLVSGPGGYRAKDFVRVGFGLQILVFITAMVMARFYWRI